MVATDFLVINVIKTYIRIMSILLIVRKYFGFVLKKDGLMN